MISDFFPELGRTEIGKKAGFLGSAYYIGNFAGSLMVSSNLLCGNDHVIHYSGDGWLMSLVVGMTGGSCDQL